MSPRKTHFRVPSWQVRRYRKEGKRVLHGPYDCLRCGERKMRIEVDKEEKEVKAFCLGCDVVFPLEYAEYLEPVDYYNKLVDQS